MKVNNIKHIVIVGAGLGGCFVADTISNNFKITLIELGTFKESLNDRIIDLGLPAITNPHISSGLGGTTLFWHNGLMKIPNEIIDDRWPIKSKELLTYYEKAFIRLSKIKYDLVDVVKKSLLKSYREYGLAENNFGELLLYPKKRINPWSEFKLAKKVNLVYGEVISFNFDDNGNVKRLIFKNSVSNTIEEFEADIFILCAGGLSTPLILDETFKDSGLGFKKNIGSYYEDHPCSIVGKIELHKPINKLWNYIFFGGNLRIPFLIKENGLHILFQLRPTYHISNKNGRHYIKSILGDLRNNPLSISLYWELIKNLDDISELISLKLGLNIPTTSYHILMVAEQLPSASKSIWGDTSDRKCIYRNWIIDEGLILIYQKSIKNLIFNI
jgi:hypothetical protein